MSRRNAATLCLILFTGLSPAPIARAQTPPADPEASSQTPLEWEPYRVALVLSAAGDGHMTPRFREQLAQRVEALVRRTIGPAWQCHVSVIDRPWPVEHDDPLHVLPSEAAGTLLHGRDKLFVIQLAWETTRYRLSVREFDVPTARWGRPAERDAVGRDRLDRELLQLCLTAFTPTGSLVPIEKSGSRGIKLKAAALVPPDPTVRFAAPGTIFRLLRITQRDQQSLVSPVAWTYLKVDGLDGPVARCRLFSAFRDPATQRAPGSRLIAQAAAYTDASTPLRLLRHDGTPLAGAEMILEDDLQRREPLVIVADGQGRLTIPASHRGLVSLTTSGGGRARVRLWLLAGGELESDVRLRDDAAAVELQGELRAIQEAVVDEIARRSLAIRRVHALMSRQAWPQAEKIVNDLNVVEQPFAARIVRLRAALQQQAEAAARKIDPGAQRALEEIESTVERFLPPQQIADLTAEFNKRKPSPASPPPPKPQLAVCPVLT